ncbi:MAG: GNAT family protein [Limnochordales bacterium]|nr:MAG: hypothetical protein DIU83_06660 [Bacillota bacterium]
MYVMRGRRVALRPVTPEDFPLLVKWNLDEGLNELAGGARPTTLEECALWHKRLQSHRHWQLFGIEAAEVGLIGDIELDHIAWRSGEAELRVRIGEPSLRGKGLGTEAVRLMLAYAFERLNLTRVYVRVLASNRQAIASYRKAGFKSEGFLTRSIPPGRSVRIVLMRILRDEFHSVNVRRAQGIAADM